MAFKAAAGALASIWKNRVPGQLVIQMTDRCNAKCPQCGMRVTEKFPRTRIPVDDLKAIIDAAAEKGFQAVSFTGGEPLLYLDDLAGLIRYAGAAGIPFIRTGTNGFLFAGPGRPGFEDRVKKTVDALADTPLRNFWISVDSADPAVHEGMRGFPGVIRGIEYALPLFHQQGLYPSANLGINRLTGGAPPIPPAAGESDLPAFEAAFEEAFRRFYSFVENLGFTMVNACYPMSVEEADDLSAVYAATAPDAVVKFTDLEKAALFRTLCRVLPEFRGRLRVFSPRSSLHALARHYNGGNGTGHACRGGVDFFFVNAKDQNVYPCGYRGADNLGPMTELNLDALAAEPFCRRCDWECFRDPSELLGPFLEAPRHPVSLVSRFGKDRRALSLWAGDLLYYSACGFFDGRKAPNKTLLALF